MPTQTLVGPDLHEPETHLRCPACAGAVRPGAPWCTQCWADLRPAVDTPPAPPTGTAPTASPAPSTLPPVPLTAPSTAAPSADEDAAAPSGASWPCATCGAANGLDTDTCSSCGAGFLAALRSEGEPLLVLPVVGDLGALSRAQRLGVAAAVVVAVVLAVLVLGLLLG